MLDDEKLLTWSAAEEREFRSAAEEREKKEFRYIRYCKARDHGSKVRDTVLTTSRQGEGTRGRGGREED